MQLLSNCTVKSCFWTNKGFVLIKLDKTQPLKACISQTKIIVDAGECEDANINQDKLDNKNEFLTPQEN